MIKCPICKRGMKTDLDLALLFTRSLEFGEALNPPLDIEDKFSLKYIFDGICSYCKVPQATDSLKMAKSPAD